MEEGEINLQFFPKENLGGRSGHMKLFSGKQLTASERPCKLQPWKFLKTNLELQIVT
jgi:hypothetical protein